MHWLHAKKDVGALPMEIPTEKTLLFYVTKLRRKQKQRNTLIKVFINQSEMTRQSIIRGSLAFFIILLMMPLGHAFVVLMGRHLEGAGLKTGAFLLGLAGVLIAVLGNRMRGEAMQVLAGAFGAILFWGAWVEFIFISYAKSLHVPPLMNGDVILTKPEYLMMPSTLPFAVLALIMYVYWAKTDWGLIKLFRKWLKITPITSGKGRNESIKAFIDLLLLIWWAYLILLVEYDPELLGERHPVTLVFASICLIAAIILFVRSLRAPTWASALRQAIVTVCVLWTFVEVMIRLKLFTEIWIYPENYIVEMICIAVAFVVAIFIMARLGHRNIKRG